MIFCTVGHAPVYIVYPLDLMIHDCCTTELLGGYSLHVFYLSCKDSLDVPLQHSCFKI